MRDSYASFVGHPPLLEYMTLATGETTREEMRVKLIEKMVRPVGPPPEVWLAAPDEGKLLLIHNRSRIEEPTTQQFISKEKIKLREAET